VGLDLCWFADSIKEVRKRNAIILYALRCSDTTLVAAERTGRRGYALEISPHYVDTIVKRVSEAVGREAVLDASSETFDAVRQWRASGLEATSEIFDAVRLWRASGLDREDAQMG
jgi:hypothetical protein